MTKEEVYAENAKLEKKGRIMLLNFFHQNKQLEVDTDLIRFFEDKWNGSDLTYYSGITNYFITYAELKTRNYNSYKRWDGTPEGWVLEKHKYDDLMLKKGSTQDKIVYINIFRNGMAIWDLTSKKYKETDWVTQQLSTDHTKQKKTEKKVIYLKINEACHFFNNNFKF